MWDFLSETSIIYKVKCIMVNKDSDIEIIISRYLSKEATPEEIKVLDERKPAGLDGESAPLLFCAHCSHLSLPD